MEQDASRRLEACSMRIRPRLTVSRREEENLVSMNGVRRECRSVCGGSEKQDVRSYDGCAEGYGD